MSIVPVAGDSWNVEMLPLLEETAGVCAREEWVQAMDTRRPGETAGVERHKITDRDWDTLLAVVCKLVSEHSDKRPCDVLRAIADRAEEIARQPGDICRTPFEPVCP